MTQTRPIRQPIRQPFLNPPSHCDICHQAINKTFYDTPTRAGTWGYLCSQCRRIHGQGTVRVLAKKYNLQSDGLYYLDDPKASQCSHRPTISTLTQWLSDGVSRCHDGCKVEPDADCCEHGSPNWLVVEGVI